MITEQWWLAFVIFSLVGYIGVGLAVLIGGIKDLRDLLKQLSEEKSELE